MLIYWLWSLPDQFWPFLKVFGKFKKSKMADPRCPPFENKTLLWRHMTSSAELAYLNGNIFRRAICPLSFVVIALIFSELRGGGGIPPRSHKTKKKPGLNRVNQLLFERMAWCRKNLSRVSKIFINIRELPDGMAKKPKRIFKVIRYLSSLPDVRPFGLLFEESGKYLPEDVSAWTAAVRRR